MKYKVFIMYVLICFACFGCTRLDTSELTTQSREYIEITEQDNSSLSNITETSDYNDIYLKSDSIMSAFPNVDFNENVLRIDENITSLLTPKLRYSESDELLYVQQELYDENGNYIEYPFYIKINSAKIIKNCDDLDEYFKQCDFFNDLDNINWYGEDIIKDSPYICLNITLKNLSNESCIVNMNNKNIEVVYDDIGKYRISEDISSFVDFDYIGNNRLIGKSCYEVKFECNEEITFNVVYLLQGYNDEDLLYFNVNDNYRSGEVYDDGTWHADTKGAPNIIKINLDKE